MAKENFNVILSQVPKVSYLYSAAENARTNTALVEKEVQKAKRDKKPRKVQKLSKAEKQNMDTKENADEEVKRKIDLII